MSALPPILRFLADADLELGPFGILGLTKERCDEPAITDALRRQLDRLARHPHGGTVEADEVRLALHVAAAQLRDPAVREELIEELGTLRNRAPHQQPTSHDESVPQTATSARSVQASRATTAPSRAAASSFEFTAMWVIAHSGGWNGEAKRRLWALAHASSVNPSDLPAIITRVAQRARPAAIGPGAFPHHADLALPSTPGARSRHPLALPVRAVAAPIDETPLRKWGPLILIVVLTLSSLVMIRAIAVIRGREASSRTVRLPQSPSSPIINTPAPPILALPPSSKSSTPAARDAEASTHAPPVPASATPRSAAPSLADQAGARTLIAPAPIAPLEPAVELWLLSAKRAIASAPARPTPEERLQRALRLATVNSAAEKQWLGDSDEARRLIGAADTNSAPYVRPGANREEQDTLIFRLTSPATGDDGRIARYFQLARRQPGSSLDALNRLRFRQEPLGPADCDVIAEVALFGPTIELRSLARHFVDDQASNPIMLYSLLESARQAPRTRASAELIERLALRTLPPPANPDWPRAVRAAILARLLEMLAVDRNPIVDELAYRLTAAYSDSVGSAVIPGADPTTEDGGEWRPSAPGADSASQLTPAVRENPPDSRAASRLLELWRTRCDAFKASPELAARLMSILQRHESRLALASGPTQRFLAEQSTIVDLAALAVAAERPTRALEVRAIVDATSERRRAARHAFEQIESNERALTRLWLVRFGAPIQSRGDDS